jgi:hypothetical protein
VKNRILSVLLAAMLALSVSLIGCEGDGAPGITEYNLAVSSTEGRSLTTPGVPVSAQHYMHPLVTDYQGIQAEGDAQVLQRPGSCDDSIHGECSSVSPGTDFGDPVQAFTDDTPQEYPFHGHYPSVEELYSWYDDLAATSPKLISKIHTGSSWEGRDLWVLEITSDEDTQVDYKSGFLVDATIHAREWSTTQVAMYLIWRLLTGYDSDKTIYWLLNNRRIYVMPMFNPDGYVYDGDGTLGSAKWWRKNRNDTTPTYEIGVDLNRNWDHFWEYGSNDPGEDTYRGQAPFSEYETRYMRDFVLNNTIDSYQNLHSYGGTIVIPWSHNASSCPHDDWYRGMAAHMTSFTSRMGDESQHYSYGQPYEQIGYNASGTVCDWMYAVTGAQVLGIELETGGWRCYPEPNAIMTINTDVCDALIYQARVSDVDLGDRTNRVFPPIPYIVYGEVTDLDASPVVGITVSLKNLDTEEALFITTDMNGYYELNCGNLVQHGYSPTDTLSVSAALSSRHISIGDEWGARVDMEVPIYDLSVSCAAGGMVAVPGEGVFTYPEGAVVSLVAEPDDDYRFVNWTGDITTVDDPDAAVTTIAIEDDCTISANFEEKPPEPSGRGCFIATAAYGTPMAEEIVILRKFRDDYLLTNSPGQGLVDVYYTISPPIADFIADHFGLKPIVRAGLMPVVAMSTVAVNSTVAEKIAMVGLLLLVSTALAIWVIRRRRGDSQCI